MTFEAKLNRAVDGKRHSPPATNCQPAFARNLSYQRKLKSALVFVDFGAHALVAQAL